MPTVPRKVLSWRDLVACDYFRVVVAFQDPDITTSLEIKKLKRYYLERFCVWRLRPTRAPINYMVSYFFFAIMARIMSPAFSA
jgi:hypothetical protein